MARCWHNVGIMLALEAEQEPLRVSRLLSSTEFSWHDRSTSTDEMMSPSRGIGMSAATFLSKCKIDYDPGASRPLAWKEVATASMGRNRQASQYRKIWSGSFLSWARGPRGASRSESSTTRGSKMLSNTWMLFELMYRCLPREVSFKYPFCFPITSIVKKRQKTDRVPEGFLLSSQQLIMLGHQCMRLKAM